MTDDAISGSEIPPDAPDRLAELTGRDAEEFRADDYDILDFEDQDIIVPDGGETAGRSTDGTARSCPGCGTTPDRSHKVGEWAEDDPSGVYRCDSAGCRVERFHVPDWSIEMGGQR